MVKSYFCGFQQASYTLSNGQSITFSDMCVDNRGSLYTSANTEEQKMIESLPDFGGVIKVYKCYGEPDPVTPTVRNVVKAEVVIPASNAKEYPEVKRIQDAISVIKDVCAERGVEYSVIRSRESVMERAKFFNISFPNLN